MTDAYLDQLGGLASRKSYKSSLHNLLMQREEEEREAMRAYGKALLERERATSRYRELEEELTNAWVHLSEQLEAGCDDVQLAQTQGYCQSLEWRLKDAEIDAGEAREYAESTFVHLLSARQARALVQQYLNREKGAAAQRDGAIEDVDEITSLDDYLALESADSPHSIVWN